MMPMWGVPSPSVKLIETPKRMPLTNYTYQELWKAFWTVWWRDTSRAIRSVIKWR